MRDERRNYTIVGGFVIAMVAALVFWIILIAGRISGGTDTYYIVYQDVLGLEEDTQILYMGFPVGYIDSIEPIGEKEGYRVDVHVRRNWQIPADSTAEIIAPGLLSAVVVNIRAGESEEAIAPGQQIPGVEASNLFAVAAAVMQEVRDAIDPLLASIGESTPGIVKNLESFSDDLNATLSRINTLISPENVDHVRSILANLDATSSNFATVSNDLGQTRARIDDLLAKVDTIVAGSEGDVQQVVADLRDTLDAVARRIDAITDNLEATTRNMNEFSRQIRQNPGIILRGREVEDGAGAG